MCVVSLVDKKRKTPTKSERFSMARPTGFEPAISSVTGRRDRPASLRAQNSMYDISFLHELQGVNLSIHRVAE